MANLNFEQIRALNAMLALGSDISLIHIKDPLRKLRKHIPGENLLWTLIVDGTCWKNEKGFEGYAAREYGYQDIQLTSQAILTALKDIDQELSMDLILNIYNIFRSEDEKHQAQNPFIFFATGTFGVVKKTGGLVDRKTVTVSGLQQLQARIEDGYYTNYNLNPSLVYESLEITPNESNIREISEKLQDQNQNIVMRCSFHVISKEKNNLGNKVQILKQAIENYNRDIKLAQSPDDKLKIIVEYVQLFEQIHPHHNYNCRTYCVAILNRLLIQNGFMPVIQLDPNNFDMNSIDELVIEVKKGIKRTEVLLDKKKSLENNKVIISYDPQKFEHAFHDFKGLSSKEFEDIINNVDNQTAKNMVNVQTKELGNELAQDIIDQFKSNPKLYDLYQQKVNETLEKEGDSLICYLKSGGYLMLPVVDELCRLQSKEELQQNDSQSESYHNPKM